MDRRAPTHDAPAGRRRSRPRDADDLLALENQVCFALAVAARGVIGVYRPILEPLGLTHPQYLVMLALWGRSPRTVRDLGEALQLEPATLSPLLKRLEAQGYVTRERSARDERALDVALTDAGRALRERALGDPAAGRRPAGHEPRGARRCCATASPRSSPRCSAADAAQLGVSAAAPNDTANCTHQRSTVGYAARSTSAGMS